MFIIILKQFIKDKKNKFTKFIDFFNKDIETFLGIKAQSSNRRDKKNINVMWHYFNGKISEEKIDKLKQKIDRIIKVE